VLRLGFLVFSLCFAAAAAERPNVILLMTDDQGYGELSAHGNPVLKTPNLDRLHAESVRFTDFHVAPMCTPTRGQLLTGLDAARNGAINVSSGRTLLRAEIPTLADFFGANGYRTAIFGKWHLGDNTPYRPEERGFQETLWFPSSHVSSVPDFWGNDYFHDTYIRNGKREAQRGYCTDLFFGEALAWMKKRADADEPFFLYLPTNAPHAPFWAPEKELREAKQMLQGVDLPEIQGRDRDNFAAYLAMILNVDANVGRLSRFLDEEGLANDTILVFLTDNGSTFGYRYFNAGMRGHKTELWEGGHRVPLFVRWPGGGIGEPRDVSGLTQVQDVAPTLMDLAGLVAPSAPRFDGISLGPVLRGRGAVPEERMVVINYSRMPMGFDYPSPEAQSILRREGAGVLWKRWRLLEDRELYDLASDPTQQHNVIAEHPEVAAKMRAHLDKWWDGVKDTANEPQAVTIGSDAENPMLLTACEWLDVFVDQQGQVRRGVRKNGYWHLNVAEAGEYELELRRWPREAKTPLSAGLPATKVTAGELPAGVALPIARARVRIGEAEAAKPVGVDDQAAVFSVTLSNGPALLHTWFDDERGEPITGAYYVYVRRK
jgi:arylsulfatase